MMISNFRDFILEGRSINNDIKLLSNDIILLLSNQFDIIYDDYINNKTNVSLLSINNLNIYCYQKDYNLIYNLNRYLKDINIKDININLCVKISNNLKNVVNTSDSNFDISSTYIINDVIQTAYFNFNLYLTEELINYKNIKKTGIITTITHELTHLLWFYKLEINSKKLSKSYNKNINLQNLKLTLTNYQYENFYDIIYRLYLCLEHEINANSAEIYNYLLYSDSETYDELIAIYKNSNVYNKINYLKNFDTNIFLNNIKKIYNMNDILIITNNIIDELNIQNDELNIKIDNKLKNINNEILLVSFLNKLNKLFKNKSEILSKNIHRLISEVYDDKHKFKLKECKTNIYNIF